MLQRNPTLLVLMPAAVIIGVASVLFLTAPKAEDFWWTDGASFALNGELIHDYIVSGLHQSPLAFANEWFRRFPALSISLYPPLFPLAEAGAFALFGFSHAVAQATVAGFVALAAFGAYRLGRVAADPLQAAGAVLLTFSAPGILLWSRQVMMEVPALAFALLASSYLLHYQADRRTRDMALATFLTLCAVYTKQTAIFIVPAFVIALFADAGWRLLRDRVVWIAAGALLVGALPLAVFTFLMAGDAIDIALGKGLAANSGGALQGAGHFAQAWAYLGLLPEIIGWPLLAATAGSIGFAVLRGSRSPAEKRLVTLMLAWFVGDFGFIAATGHVEARYGMALGVPCAMLATLLITRLPRSSRSWATFGIGVVSFAVAVCAYGVNRMAGYDKVAAYVVAHSSRDAVIWLQQRETKNLIFSIRTHDPASKRLILRSEKFLVDYHISRDWGVQDRDWKTADLEKLIDRNHVSMVVLQPGFWSDLPSMARMQDYVYSDRFKLVAEFPITADDPSQRTTIKVFVNQRPVDAVGTGAQ
jgi:4-amino-4-deoxy-L-arabinose transferase-like glycosyltransferase